MPQRIPLQPAASPVDQFHLPNVNKPAQTNQLLQLAGALASVRPELQQILDTRADAWVKQSLALGDSQRQQLALTNQQQMKEAVAKGLIREGDNPWVMLAVKQGVARVEAESAASEMLDTYYKSGMSTEDDLSKVQGFAQKFMSDRFHDRDPDELKAIGPVVEQAIGRLSAEHVHQRADERLQEAQITIETLTEKYAQDLKTTEDPAQRAAILTQYQQAMLPLTAGLSWPKVNAAKLRGAESAALAAKDVSLYDEIVGNIQTPGGSYANTAEAKNTRERLLSHITEQEDRDSAHQDRLEKHQNEQILRTYLKSYQDHLNEARKTNPNAGPTDIGWTVNAIEGWDLPEDVKDELWGRIFNRLQAKEAAKGVDQKQARENATQMLGDKKTVLTGEDLDAVSVKTGVPKAELIGVASELNRFRDQDTQEGTDAIIEMRMKPGGPTVTDLKSLRDGGQISNDTFLKEAARVTEGRSGLPIGFGEVLRADAENLSNVVLTSLNKDGLTREQWAQSDFRGFMDASQKADDLQRSYNDEVFATIDADPDHSYAHLSEVKNRIRDRLVKQFREDSTATAPAPAEKPKTLVDQLSEQIAAKAGDLIKLDDLVKFSPNIEKATEAHQFGTDWKTLVDAVRQTDVPIPKEVSGQYTAPLHNFNDPLDKTVPVLNHFRHSWLDSGFDPDYSARTQASLISDRQANEQRLGVFMDQAIQAFKSRSQGTPLSVSQKEQILNADRYLQLVTEQLIAGGMDVLEAKKRIGDDAWHKVPLFISRPQLNKYGVKAAEQFGIQPGTPEFQSFILAQQNFLANQIQHFNN